MNAMSNDMMLEAATGAELKLERRALVERQNRLAWRARDILDSTLREEYGRLHQILRQWDRLDGERRAIEAELVARDAMTRAALT